MAVLPLSGAIPQENQTNVKADHKDRRLHWWSCGVLHPGPDGEDYSSTGIVAFEILRLKMLELQRKYICYRAEKCLFVHLLP
jgi:hypothetical protein